MKIVALLFTPLLAGFAAAVVPSRHVVVRPPSTVTTRALMSTRGGDIFGSDENLVAIFSFFNGFYGAVGMPAPDVSGEAMNINIKDGTLTYLLYESAAAATLGTAIMAYLATFTEMSVTKVVAFGGLSCAYVSYKNQLKGLFHRLGFINGFGLVVTSFMLLCLFLMFAGDGAIENVAKVFAIPPLVMGLSGVISPNVGASLIGLSTPLVGPTLTFYSWNSYNMLAWGILAQALLRGEDVSTAIGYAAVVQTVGMLDSMYGRKYHNNVRISDKAISLLFLAVPALSAIGLLLPEEAIVIGDMR